MRLAAIWSLANGCSLSGIRATLLPALISFCAAVSVKQYDTFDPVTALLYSSCSSPHSLAVQALSSQLKTRVQQEAQQLTGVLKVSLLFSCLLSDALHHCSSSTLMPCITDPCSGVLSVC